MAFRKGVPKSRHMMQTTPLRLNPQGNPPIILRWSDQIRCRSRLRPHPLSLREQRKLAEKSSLAGEA
eukprot:418621-Pyramimonas_sp.AAC.1